MDKSRKLKDYRMYTLAFLGVTALTFCWFVINNKCFIWLGSGNDLQDGLTQHYSTFVYYGQYIREFLKNLLVHHTFQMPMWDYAIGYGSDIVTTLHYYGIGEPLMALSCLVPVRYSEGGYCLFILLRIYLAGISFLFFCHYHKKAGMSVIFGSLIYCMSGYTLFAGIRHPMFLIPLIFFPVLCLGADKIFLEKKPVLFIVATALSALSNFYFFYMECLFLAGYILWHCFVTYKENKLKLILYFAGCSGLAVAIAAVLLLPNVMVLLTSERLQAGHYVPLFYDLSYYTKIFSTFMGGSGRYYANLGYGVLSFLAVALLFLKKERKELKLAFVLLTVFLCIPWMGHFFNGLSYVTNRWMWIYNFLISFIVAEALPDLWLITKQEKIRLAVLLGGYAVFCMVFQGTRREQTFVLFSVTFFFLAVILMREMVNITERQIQLALVLVFFVSFGINGMYAFGHDESDLLGEYLDAGKGMDVLLNAEASQIDNAAFQYRFDQYGVEEPYNAAWPLNQRGVSFHFSLTNPNISQFYQEMGLNTPYDYSYNNLDARSALEALASVNQFIIPNGENKYLPYNYRSHQRVQTDEVSVYSTSHTLPLGYTYDSWICREEYEKLNSVEKQEAMLKGVVLDLESSDFPRTEMKIDTKELDFDWESDEGSVVEGSSISVGKENSQVKLNFQSISNCELYIEIGGIQYDPGDAFFGYTEEELSLLSVYDKNRIRSEQRYRIRESNPFFYIKGNGVKKKVNYLTDENSFYCGRDSFTVNVGYLDKETDKITLIFPRIGVYSFESVRVIAQPVEQINDSIGQRGEHILENVQLGENFLSGEISLENPQILCLSIPYSEGWRAYVDGQEAEVRRANTMYTALEVPAGVHDIVLRYETPYLKLGACISLAGIFVLVGVCGLTKVYKYVNA
ncbi:MAG: YfhO family protein [Roseburia sp.]|nr:YfhO family protein [Roseburia sp.]